VDELDTGIEPGTTASLVDDESRAARKRRTILDAATEAFLTGGYSRTSMDDVARLAKVSKQTVYQHFGDKERLVTEVVYAIVTGAGAPVDTSVHRLASSTDLAGDLRDHGRRQLHAVLQPRPMQLRRLVIAEAVTFPALGAALYEHGPGRTIAELGDAFERLQQRGFLRSADPKRVASDFNWLLMSEPLNRAMILGDDGPPDPAHVNKWADQAVDTFLAAYATPDGSMFAGRKVSERNASGHPPMPKRAAPKRTAKA
jgi:TetR/AcrR family transcriptional regulator, mexJK operon transcriptional repressor